MRMVHILRHNKMDASAEGAAETQKIRTLCTVETSLSPDTIEWCPLNDFGSLMALGCYQLESGEAAQRIAVASQPS